MADARRRTLSAAAAIAAAAVVIGVAALSIAGCYPNVDPDGDWRSAVTAVLDEQAAAWNRGDVAGYMEGYWKSDSLLFTSGGNVRRGWNATLEKYRASYDTREKMGTLTFSKLELYHPAPGAAWVFGRWELERANDRPGGVFTLVLRKFPEGWKVVHDHTSSDPPERQ